MSGFTGGATGKVMMDDLADRAPLFAAFYIAPNREKVMKMVHMESIPISNCDSQVNKTGCFDLKLTDILTGFWPSDNGSMPLDEPYCGYRGQKCSYTLEIAVGAIILAIIIGAFATYILYRYW